MKYILVTGGAGGIGSAIVRKYQSLQNTHVIVADIQPFSEGSFANMESIVIDVTDAVQVAKLASTLTERGITVSHLISVAGGALPDEWSRLHSVPDEIIEKSVRLNLVSHIFLTKYLMSEPTDESSDRSIVFISSINALQSYGLTAYSAAKAGLIGLTRELAGSLAPHIRVNTVLPGTVETPRTRKQPKDFDVLRKKTHLQRLAHPDDIAAACYFLTHMTTAVTGAEIVVDAGQSICTT